MNSAILFTIMATSSYAQVSPPTDEMMQDAVAKGAIIHPGQFGSVIEQYKDHYCERPANMMGGVCNKGQWKPVETSHGMPKRKGLKGEVIVDDSLKTQWIWYDEKWNAL